MSLEEIQSKFGLVLENSKFESGRDCAVLLCPSDKFLPLCDSLRYEFLFEYLKLISVLDRGAVFEIYYQLYSFAKDLDLVIKTAVSRNNASLPSMVAIWPAANWHERECFDLFGIEFSGHPDMRRILLPADWEGFPLRRDYEKPSSYNGIEG